MRVRIEIMVLHHNDSECRKGRKEGCWSVGSPNPRSGQAGRRTRMRTAGHYQGHKEAEWESKKKKVYDRKQRGATTSNQLLANIQQVRTHNFNSLHNNSKTGRVQPKFQWDFFRPFFHLARFTALEHQHEQTGRDHYKAIYTFPVVPF